jgi:hypothetical protein
MMALKQMELLPWATFTEGHIRNLAATSEADITVQTARGSVVVENIAAAQELLQLIGRPQAERKTVAVKQKTEGAGGIAQRFLYEFLKHGGKRASDVARAARAQGISRITLRRAAKKAGVISVAGRENEKIAYWEWKLSDPNWRPPATPVHEGKVAKPSSTVERGYSGDRRKEGFGRTLVYKRARY